MKVVPIIIPNTNIIPKIEYDIVSHCNLNCKNCSHFSEFKDKEEIPLEVIKDELQALQNKIKTIRFKICGGEPTLHSNILGVISATREILKDETKIVLNTNGMKIPSLGKSFLYSLKANNIVVNISIYPINVDYPSILKSFEDLGIQYATNEKIAFHNAVDPTGTQDPEHSFKVCTNDTCRCVFYGKKRIWSCSYVANAEFLNERFKYQIESDSVSIDDPLETIQEYLSKPCSTCRFCNVSAPLIKWGLHKKDFAG